MGDPAGIGPEIIVKALIGGQLDPYLDQIRVAGDVQILVRAALLFGIEARWLGETSELSCGQRRLKVAPLSRLSEAEVPFGQLRAENGRAMLNYIEWACEQCRTGKALAMVTAPIHKEAIHAAGCVFPGHTELLAQRCGVERVVMMLGGPRLNVCLVTTHLALRRVPQQLTFDEILQTIRITNDAFQRYFCRDRKPKIAVLALNPHAGEGGLFGDEERVTIGPAIEQARAEGIEASGPHSADTLFYFAANGGYDAVVCMYHDQGLIPLKLLHFEDGVNVTLGLPIIRTSVDHGTAYDQAGKGTASAQSLVAAVKMAVRMANNHNA
ncbi:MAG: 4-hydroxythreonine-4-phosphate dehydrogenase PdxA [Desulfuromonadaceae bacterium]|nr:4-hydroxythreonine-4-phosphate dehydrogenase PdxA [Desulfuromonadaceae bacterium]